MASFDHFSVVQVVEGESIRDGSGLHQPATADAIVDECPSAGGMIMLSNSGREVLVVCTSVGVQHSGHNAPRSSVLACRDMGFASEPVTPGVLAGYP